MATIINKTAPTPLIPLANPGGVSIPSSAMAAIESAMAHPHISTNKAASKKSKKKAKKQQKNTQAAMYKNTASVPTQDVEVVEAEITEPVKEEAVLPEVTTPSVVIAHTEERKSVKATFPSEGIQNMINDFRGMKDAIIAHHNNGEILPEGFAAAVREIADTIDAIDKEDAVKRGISLNKDVYDNNTEPDYDPSTLKFTRGIPKSKKYKRLIVPINDYAFMNGEFTEYPSKTGRSITKIIRDNLRYVDDGDIITSGEHVVIPGSSSMVASGLIAIPDTPDLPMHSSWDAGVIRMLVYMPNDKFHQFMMGKEELMITHSFFDNDVDLSDPDIIEECNIASAVSFTLDELKTLMSDNDIIFEASMNINIAQSQYNHALPVGLAPDGNIVMISALEIKG